MKLYYISNILPMEVIHSMGRSVAGAQSQVTLAKELDGVLNGDVELLSIVRQGNKESKQMCDRIVFGNKRHDTIFHINRPFLEELFAGIQVFFKTLKWALKNRKEDRKVLFMNAPNEVITPVLLLKKMGLCEAYSFLIDSPFAITGVESAYLKWRKKDYEKGLKKLNKCNGVILLNNNVVRILGLTNPTKTILLGFEASDCNFRNEQYSDIKNRKKRLMYAGTLSYVNGIEQMLNAFALLNEDDYIIDICGYGPQEDLVNSFCEKHKNATYHGRVSNEELDNLYSQADLLVNIRLPEDEVNNFSFPSKLIGYLYSGTVVVSSDFSSLPDSYRDFIYVTKDIEPQTIADEIEFIFAQDESVLTERARKSREFVEKNQNWTAVTEDMVDFIKKN